MPARILAGAAIVGTLLVAGAVVAPATSASAARPPRACKPDVSGAVNDAFNTVFSRTSAATLPAARAARLQDGASPGVLAVLQAWLADPADNNTTVTVNDVECRSARRAAVGLDVVFAGVTMRDILPRGAAVLDGGTWKVARSTFCARMSLSNPAFASGGACAARPRR
jgi:hypothetical protein